MNTATETQWIKQRPVIATEQHLKTPWGGNARNFRCGFCGYSFRVGDRFRWVYTNDIPGCGGNPFICKKCDTGTNDDARQKWQGLCLEFLKMSNEKYWFFTRRKK